MAQEVLGRARLAGDPEAVVVALRAHAWARHAALDNAAAVRLLGEAVRLATSHGLDERLGEVLTTRAAALLELGRDAAAARDLARATPLVAGPRRAEVTFQRAVAVHNAGRIRPAAELYRQVMADPDCPPETWVKAANNGALALTTLGRARVALPWLQRAAELAEPMSPLLVALTRNNLAVTTFQTGAVVEGLRLFEQAGALYVPAGLPLGEHYMDYADALVDLRLLDEALRITRAAAAEFEREGARLMAVDARLRSARLAVAVGQLAPARDDVRAARELLRRQRRPGWVARALLAEAEIAQAGGADPGQVLPALRRAARALAETGQVGAAVEAHLAAGQAAMAAGRAAAARADLDAAARLARRQGLLVRLRGRLARALAADLDGDPDATLRQCRQGLTDLSRHRAALPSVELRALAAWHGAELGGLGLRIVLAAGSPTRALDWMERTRTASLLTVEPPIPELDADVAELRAVEGELRLARREQGREPAELVSRRAGLEGRIRRASWVGAGGRGDRVDVRTPTVTGHDLGRLRTSLAENAPGTWLAENAPGTWLAELAEVDGELFAVVLGGPAGASTGRPRLVRLGPVPPVTMAAQSALFALRRGLRGDRFASSARDDALECLAELRRAVIEPLGVPAGVPLVVVPAGPLHRVPWAPLHPGPLTLAPSAAFWLRSAAARAEPLVSSGGGPDPGRVVLVAGPGLAGAVEEVTDLATVHPVAARLLPPDSTVEATVRLVTGAQLAHLACHGRLRTDNALFSALELSDGMLTVHELLARGVAPGRMVLAACDSGAEGSYHGNEVLGFVSALMARGTRAVLASVMPLPDGASVALMHRLHERLRAGDTMAQALHRARTSAAASLEAAATLDAGTFTAWCGLASYGAG
jgi:tetratricopeptide (TPR) repeat protein